MAENKSGMEMMINSLLRAAGFDAEELKKNISDTIGGFQLMAKSIFDKLESIDAEQKIISIRLERLEKHLGVGEDRAHTNGDGRKSIAGPIQ